MTKYKHHVTSTVVHLIKEIRKQRGIRQVKYDRPESLLKLIVFIDNNVSTWESDNQLINKGGKDLKILTYQ